MRAAPVQKGLLAGVRGRGDEPLKLVADVGHGPLLVLAALGELKKLGLYGSAQNIRGFRGYGARGNHQHLAFFHHLTHGKHIRPAKCKGREFNQP